MRQRLADNVFALRKASPELGIPLVTPKGGGHAIQKIGTGQTAPVVPFGDGPERPDTPHKVLRSAEPGIKGFKRKECLVRRVAWIGIIVQVTARELDFTDLVEPLAGIATFWAGGEGKEPFVQYGPRFSSYERDDLFVLSEREWILVCDRERRVMYLGCKNGQPVWRAATTEEIADRVHYYGMHADFHSSIFWANQTLVELGVSSKAAEVLARIPGIVTDADRDRFRRTGRA
ncbi:MAG: hypothetical protein AB199_03085 [Parcubacteria bacterium C7867-004]|nr:MAG: hypothetical protein AB199_03085 [Parcubacteria bacterium C7867-004]